MGAVPLQRHGRRRAARRPQLPLHDRHDRPGRSLDQVPEGPHAPEADFIYFSPGATHAPHHVPKEWIARWKGKFDQGWDKMREETLARQIKLGVVPPGTQARAQTAGDQGLGHALGRREAPVRTPGRGLRRVRGIHGPRDRPDARGVRGRRPGRKHARRLHRRRQRHQRRRRPERHVQRVHVLQRRAGDRCRHAEEDRPVGRAGDLPAHGGRLGGCAQCAVRLDEAGALGLRRHAQRHGHVAGPRASRRRTGSARSSAT